MSHTDYAQPDIRQSLGPELLREFARSKEEKDKAHEAIFHAGTATWRTNEESFYLAAVILAGGSYHIDRENERDIVDKDGDDELREDILFWLKSRGMDVTKKAKQKKTRKSSSDEPKVKESQPWWATTIMWAFVIVGALVGYLIMMPITGGVMGAYKSLDIAGTATGTLLFAWILVILVSVGLAALLGFTTNKRIAHALNERSTTHEP